MLPLSPQDVLRYVPSDWDLAGAEQALADLRAKQAAAPDDTALASAIAAAAARVTAIDARLDAGERRSPVYFVRVPSLRARSAWQRDLTLAGARMPSDAELFRAMRAGIGAYAPADAAALLALVDAAEAAAKGEATLSELQGAEFAALQIQLLQVPAYATLVAARDFYLNVAPIIAAQHFLAGWENVAVAVETARGQITEACLAQLDRTHVLEAGWYAISLMSVSKEQAANLKSPSPSRSGRNGSATAPADPTAGPSTAAPDGTSAAGSTPPILH